MCAIESLLYLTSREVYYHCQGIIENFSYHAENFCLCEKYQGCAQRPFAQKNCCCVCRTDQRYSLERVDDVKDNTFELLKFYHNIFLDISEILTFNSAASFWNTRPYNWICYTLATETVDLFRLNLDYYFRTKK